MAMQQRSGMASCSRELKTTRQPEPLHLLAEENGEELLDNPEGSGDVMLMSVFMPMKMEGRDVRSPGSVSSPQGETLSLFYWVLKEPGGPQLM